MKSQQWYDHYSAQARKEGFPARSVFKLQEIQNSHRVLKRGARVLDLGCSPGSWLLYAAKIVGSEGAVVGVDLTQPMVTLPPNARWLVHDMLSDDASFTAALEGPFDVVLSDMAPSTSGNKFVDAQRSLRLCEAALALTQELLRPGGAFVCKVFQGEDFKAFSDQLRSTFVSVRHIKPQSSRKSSKEVFILGTAKRNPGS